MTGKTHATWSDTIPNQDGPGGKWVVLCLTCGWDKSGKYARTEGEPVALRLANTWGDMHEVQEAHPEVKRRG